MQYDYKFDVFFYSLVFIFSKYNLYDFVISQTTVRIDTKLMKSYIYNFSNYMTVLFNVIYIKVVLY
jgi:hypothetical protein